MTEIREDDVKEARVLTTDEVDAKGDGVVTESAAEAVAVLAAGTAADLVEEIEAGVTAGVAAGVVAGVAAGVVARVTVDNIESLWTEITVIKQSIIRKW